MANGHFLGGVVKGMESFEGDERAKAALGLQERGLGLQQQQIEQTGRLGERKLGLEERALGLQEKTARNAQTRAMLTEADQAVAGVMEMVGKAVDAGVGAGRPIDQIRTTIAPLVSHAKKTAALAGRDPSFLDQQVEALLARPTPVETATMAGRADLAKNQASTPPRAPGVLPGDPTPDEKNRLSKMTVSYRVLDQELQGFENLIKKNGVSILPGTEERVQYDASRRNIQMQMKELYNLGVLNGPDLMLMDSMIIDPTVGRAAKGGESGVAKVADSVFQAASAPVQALYKSALLQGSAKANIKQLREQMKTLFNANRDVIMRLPEGTSERESASQAVDWQTYFGKK